MRKYCQHYLQYITIEKIFLLVTMSILFNTPLFFFFSFLATATTICILTSAMTLPILFPFKKPAFISLQLKILWDTCFPLLWKLDP